MAYNVPEKRTYQVRALHGLWGSCQRVVTELEAGWTRVGTFRGPVFPIPPRSAAKFAGVYPLLLGCTPFPFGGVPL